MVNQLCLSLHGAVWEMVPPGSTGDVIPPWPLTLRFHQVCSESPICKRKIRVACFYIPQPRLSFSSSKPSAS